MNRAVRGTAVAALAAAAVACAVNPVTGRRELMLLSEGQEIQLGRENDEAVVAQYGLYSDADLSEWISEVGQRMAAQSERPDLPWTFRVVDDTAVNAFALPGGFIYMTRGILAYMNSEAEVAGVLGHEIGHVTARHGARQYTTSSIAQVGLGVGSILSPEVRAFGGVLQTGVGLLLLKFSRDDESQSDELGVGYAAQAGFDPRSLAAFFDTIERLSGGDGRLPTWLSTHPEPGDRVVKVLEYAQPFANRSLRVGRDEHLQRIDGIVFGDDPRQGVLEGRTLRHPELEFEIDFPNEWRVENGRAAVVSAPQDGNAVVVLRAASRSGADLESHAAAVLQGQGITAPRGRYRNLGALRAYEVAYAVDSGGNRLAVTTLFVQYNELVYELTGVTREGDLRQFSSTFADWQNTFRPWTGSELARYQPDRIRLVRARASGVLADLVDGNDAADLETLLLINGLHADDRVEAGTTIKTVDVGYPRPR